MRVGVIGAGQLGLMLGESAKPLQLECLFLDPGDQPPAAAVGDCRLAAFDDADALAELAAFCDVITYEFENVPVDALAKLDGVPVFPPLQALSAAQDRLSEKQLFEDLSIPLPGYLAVDSRDDLDEAVDRLGLPIVLKTRRFGYDGKGQAVIRNSSDRDKAWDELGGMALIAEAFVPFDFEVSVIATRGQSGDIVVYPLTQNTHANGILDTSIAPLDSPRLETQAGDYVHRLLDRLDYVGTVALELFVCGEKLLANEFAPRVHNSGHWTIEGCRCSQFENHMRAVAGLPLGQPDCEGYSGMQNLVGSIPDSVRSLEDGHFHDYGKSERPGRKVGHVTVVASSAESRDRAIARVSKIVTQWASRTVTGT
ncbi:MAG: 5-(carboxyamino)imidazole ribonucleotide synthase [Woeseiaceae bacterium]|nr:5-(carboxyamino)imidazole ribonucleotide synthase [Woeseiaceae bacterium]